jgi:type VI secretion system secreted protein VgrG
MAVLRAGKGADFTLEAGGLDADALRIVRFHGTEGMSEPFGYELELVSAEQAVSFDDVVGQPAHLMWTTGVASDDERHVHGIVSRFEQTGRSKKLTHYSARLVPKLWTLSLVRQSRIFQNKNTPDILKAVLEGAGIPAEQYQLSLKATYPPRKYCVQYRESDFDFMSRLMEEEGIWYWFAHDEEKCVVMMGDEASTPTQIAGQTEVAFREGEGGLLGGAEQIAGFRYVRSMRTGKVILQEYDFKKPQQTMKVEAEAESDAHLSSYDYPGEYPETGVGKRLAQVRLEEQQAERELGVGEGNCRRLEAGYRFALVDHPVEELNQEYLLVRVEHWGEQPQAGIGAAAQKAESKDEQTYRNVFECVPSIVTWRPPRVTPRPRVEGPQTAVVTGPEGEEIHVDEHGRVKVHFFWDLDGPQDDKSSCWVRVSQGWGGAGYGGMFLPRVGQEVVVECLEGDPDRPIITGRVYNGTNPLPYALPDEKTKSSIKSSTSPGGSGFNELRFEDKKGEEQILIQAEKDVDVYVKNDRRERIRRDHHMIVDRDQIEKVGRDEHRFVDRDQITEITRDHSLKVGGKEMIQITGTRSLEVTDDVAEASKANYSHEVGKNLYLKASGVVIEGMQELTLKVGGSFVFLDSSGVTIKGSMVKLNSGGAAGTGTAGSIVPVSARLDPAEAASAAAVQSKKGVKDDRPTHQEPKKDAPPPPNRTWIELELVDEADKPVPGEPYEVELPNGKIASGTTGADGVARVTGVEPGSCKIRFPRLDKDAWEKI